MPAKKLPIDKDQVEKLAAIMCTMEEIGSVVSCSVDTLERRFAEVIKKGRNRGKMSLKRKQYEMAMSGNVTMLIWLGKQHLGQRDRSQEEIQDEHSNKAHNEKVDALLDWLDKLEKLKK